MVNTLHKTPAAHLSDRLPRSLKRLADLAYNYWWSWASDQVSLFETINPDEWERCGHNPVALLESVSYERLTQVSIDPNYLKRLNALANQFDRYIEAKDTWASRIAPQVTREHPVAYFCAEFGIHESLPIYSGGLGILAGDHLKSASDLVSQWWALACFTAKATFTNGLTGQVGRRIITSIIHLITCPWN